MNIAEQLKLRANSDLEALRQLCCKHNCRHDKISLCDSRIFYFEDGSGLDLYRNEPEVFVRHYGKSYYADIGFFSLLRIKIFGSKRIKWERVPKAFIV